MSTSPAPFRETIARYGVTPNWEFLLPVVIAAQRNLTLRGVACADTTLGTQHHGQPVRLYLDGCGRHVVTLAGAELVRGDAWEAATMFYALVGWQHAAAEAERAVEAARGGEALLADLRAWGMREPDDRATGNVTSPGGS